MLELTHCTIHGYPVINAIGQCKGCMTRKEKRTAPAKNPTQRQLAAMEYGRKTVAALDNRRKAAKGTFINSVG